MGFPHTFALFAFFTSRSVNDISCALNVCAFHHLDEGKVFYNLYEENQLNFMWLSNLLLLLHHIIIRYYMLLNER